MEEDSASRVFKDDTEWSLDLNEYNRLVNYCGMPCTDLFVSRLNNKVKTYVAWKPDPGALAIDAFTVDWSDYSLASCFPPFSLIARVLQKIQMNKSKAIY